MIVVSGEALVDLVPVRDEEPARAGDGPGLLAPRLGGSPYNVAIATARLGARTAFLSRISRDVFGEALCDRLVASDVSTELLQRGREPTTLAVVALDDTGAARYSFYTEGTADRYVGEPESLPEETAIVSFGSLAMLLEPGASAYEAVLRRAAGADVLTVLDPNVRTTVIGDARAYRARFRSWLPHVGLLKLSEEDAAWLAEKDDGEDLTAVLLEWHEAGPSAVVLTRGADGLRVIRGGQVIDVPAAASRVADTIGAGDTVHAAILAGLHARGVRSRGMLAELDAATWREVLRYAAAAAAVTVSREGADPPYAAELV